MLECVGEIPNAVMQRQTSTNKKWAVLKSTKQTPTKRQNTHHRNTKVIKTVEFNQEQQQSRDGPAYDVTKDRGWQKVIRELHTRGWWGLSERDYTGELNQGKHEVGVKLRHTSETRLQSKVENNRKTLVNREARTHSETPRGTRKHGEQCCKKCATKSKDKGGNPKSMILIYVKSWNWEWVSLLSWACFNTKVGKTGLVLLLSKIQ